MSATANESRTLTLFGADALMLLVSLGVIFLLVGIAAALSLRTRSGVGAIAALACALLLMAFLPFWVSLSTLWFSEQTAASSWFLWLTFAAVIKLDTLFAIGALLSGIVYFAIRGTHRARTLRTLACLALLVVVAIAYVVIQLYRHALVG